MRSPPLRRDGPRRPSRRAVAACCGKPTQLQPKRASPAAEQRLAVGDFFSTWPAANCYAAAANRARIPATANTKLHFYPLLLAAALALDGRRDEARQVVDEFKLRNPGFDGARATASWSASNANPKFVDGRDRIVAIVRELGLP